MSTSPSKAQTILRWIWSNISATVALVLIVGALIVGYRFGSPTTVVADSGEGTHAEEGDGESQQMYTCSMHPTVRLPDPDAKCPICFMDLIPVIEDVGGSDNPMRMSMSESAKAMSKIETAKVGRFFPSAETRLYGNLVYDETSVARISAYFSGRIDRLYVNYIGVSVQKGDHLAEMYSPDLLAAFEELRQAESSYESSSDDSEFLRTTSSQTLTAARDKLRLFGLSQQQIEDVESGNFNPDQLTIFAPIGGVVTHLATREGDYLKTGDPIATVSDLSRLWLDLEAYESQLPMLRWGMPVTFTVEAHPGEVFPGRISFIEPMVNERTRTAAVRVAVDNKDMRLKPGMFSTAVVRSKVSANGAVIADELAGRWVSPMHPTHVSDTPGQCVVCGMARVRAESLGVVADTSEIEIPLVIPRTAVLFTGTRSVVYLSIPDQEQPTYEGRIIELGTRAGDFYTVRSGLEEGDEVVVHGAFRIDSAMQINAKPSMMMPSGGGGGGGHNHGGSPANMPKMDMSISTPEEFTESLNPVYLAYLTIQERLANDDMSGFLDSWEELKSASAQVDTTGLVGESLGIWRRSESTLKKTSPVTTIDDARAHFKTMTDAVLALQKQFGHTANETWNVAYCPMKKSSWMQRGTEIMNPYYGDMMLNCGDIQESFPPTTPQSPPIGNQADDDMSGMDMGDMNTNEHKGHTND